MNRQDRHSLVWRLWLSLAALTSACLAHATTAKAVVIDSGRLKQVKLYQPAQPPKMVAFFFASDGRNSDVIIQTLLDKGLIVAVIATDPFLNTLEKDPQACQSPAQDIALLNQKLHAFAKLSRPLSPVFMGQAQGATLAYATMVQSTPGSIKGAIFFGFCPGLALNKPLCGTNGLRFMVRRGGLGVNLYAADKLLTPMINILGKSDKGCDALATESFISNLPNGKQILLPNVGGDYNADPKAISTLTTALQNISAR